MAPQTREPRDRDVHIPLWGHRYRRHTLRLLGASALLISLTACSGATAGVNDGAENTDGLFPLTVIDTKTAIDLPLYAGIDNGAFEEAGLDVTISDSAKSPSEGMPLLLNGELSLMLVELHSGILARSEGMPIQMTTPVFVGSEPEQDPLGFANILVRSDNGIEEPQDLEGKTVAVNGIGEQPWLEAHVVLERAGVDVSAIDWVSVLVPQMPASLGQGQVDAIVVPEPLSSVVSLEGETHSVISLDDAFVDTPRFAYVATDESLEKNPAEFETFTTVFLEQAALLNADREARLDVASENLELPPEVIDVMSTPTYATEPLDSEDVDLWLEQIVEWSLAPDASQLVDADEVLFSTR